MLGCLYHPMGAAAADRLQVNAATVQKRGVGLTGHDEGGVVNEDQSQTTKTTPTGISMLIKQLVSSPRPSQ